MMSAASRNELNKLREIVHFVLSVSLNHNLTPQSGNLVCYFCRKPLLDDESLEWKSHGNTKGPKLVAEISIHHLDGNHENNDDRNKALSHRSCHKSYHRREANLKRAAGAGPEAFE